MSSPTLIIGDGNWAVRSGSLLGYEYGELSGQYNPIPITGSRASIATYTDQSGLIVSASSGVLRVDYSTGTGSLLLEPQRTNLVRNSTMVGVVSGTPGTLPTNYSFLNGGLTQSIVGIGVENGLNYIDVRLQGTATGILAQIVFDSTTSNNASAGQTYIFSLYSKLISGSANSYSIIWDEWSSTPTYLTSKATLVSLTSTTTRFSLSGTTAASCATIQPFLRFALTIGNVYDFTFRVLQPQLELGTYFTTPIFSSGSFATRIADSFSRPNIYKDGVITSGGGTWLIAINNNLSVTNSTTDRGIFIGDTNTGIGNALSIRRLNPGRLQLTKVIAGSTGLLYTTTTDTANIVLKWNGTSVDVFENGVKVVSASSFTTTNMEFLSTRTGEETYQFIPQMKLYNQPLSDAECISLTTL